MNTNTTEATTARRGPRARPLLCQPESGPRTRAHAWPRRAPAVYYGWIILGVAMVTMFMSGPGQSYSVAAFIDPMLADLGLLRSQYSLAYLVATLASGASLPFVGRVLDRVGARRLLPAFALLFGLACLTMGGVRHLRGLYLGLTFIRCLGTGALGLIATWMVGQWFVRRRGLAIGLLGLGSAFSFMAFPAGDSWLIERYGWRGAWTALAVAVWALLCVPAALLARNRPADLGVEPDRGTAQPEGGTPRVTAGPGTAHEWTARQAWSTVAFWKVVSALATSAMVSTGLVFHQVSILAGHGLTQEAALGLLGVQAFVACAMSVVGGYLADRIAPRHLLSASMVLMALAIVPLLAARSPLAALPYSVLLGMHSGIQRCSGSVTLINFFGRLHFGSVNGIATSVVTGAAALGPLPLALAEESLGGYEPALRLLLLLPLASAAAVWSAHPPGTPSSSTRNAAPAM